MANFGEHYTIRCVCFSYRTFIVTAKIHPSVHLSPVVCDVGAPYAEGLTFQQYFGSTTDLGSLCYIFGTKFEGVPLDNRAI